MPLDLCINFECVSDKWKIYHIFWSLTRNESSASSSQNSTSATLPLEGWPRGERSCHSVQVTVSISMCFFLWLLRRIYSYSWDKDKWTYNQKCGFESTYNGSLANGCKPAWRIMIYCLFLEKHEALSQRSSVLFWSLYPLITFPDHICSLQNLEGKIFQVLTPNYQKTIFKTRQNKTNKKPFIYLF